MIDTTGCDGFAMWSVKGSSPQMFVIALRNSKVSADKIFHQTDPVREPQARMILKQLGLTGLEIEQALQEARKHQVWKELVGILLGLSAL